MTPTPKSESALVEAVVAKDTDFAEVKEVALESPSTTEGIDALAETESPSKKSRRTKLKGEESPKTETPAVENKDGQIVLNGYFMLEKGTFEILKHNMIHNISTMLIGPTGLGKTEVVVNVAAALGLKVTTFDMGTMTDPIMGLVGTHTIEVKDGKTYSEFKKSRFSEVIQEPGIVLLDEISRASAAANNLLFPCLDYRRELPMEYAFGDTTPIKVHPQCVFFSTANMGSQYTGTHKLDRALIDRFMMIMMDSLTTSQTTKSLQFTFPTLKIDKINKIVKIYDGINKEHADFKIGFNLSMRHLKVICQLVNNGFTIYDAYYALCKGVGGHDGLKAIESILSTNK